MEQPPSTFKDYNDFLAKKQAGFFHFQGGRFQEARLNEKDLSDITFENVIFDSCKASRLLLKNTNLLLCRFINCEFDEVELAVSTNAKNDVSFEKGDIKTIHIQTGDFKKILIDAENCSYIKLVDIKTERLELEISKTCNNITISNVEANELEFNLASHTFNCSEFVAKKGTIKTKIDGGSISNSKFENVAFADCTIDKTKISNSEFGIRDSKTNLSNSTFTNCSISGNSFFINAKDLYLNNQEKFEGNNFEHSILDNVEFRAANFKNALLSGTKFINSKLGNCNFGGTSLVSTSFVNCDLSKADFTNCITASSTEFQNCQVAGMKIEQYAIASMSNAPAENRFTDANMMDLDIQDDALKLRMAFSSWFSWAHFISIVLWLTPYIGYAIWLSVWSKPASTITDDSHTYVIKKFLTFIFTGNDLPSWRVVARVTIFVLLLFYNANRLYLLMVAKRLELKSLISGYPVKFSFQEKRWLFKLCKLEWKVKLLVFWKINKWGVVISYILVIGNLLLFMFRVVPL